MSGCRAGGMSWSEPCSSGEASHPTAQPSPSRLCHCQTHKVIAKVSRQASRHFKTPSTCPLPPSRETRPPHQGKRFPRPLEKLKLWVLPICALQTGSVGLPRGKGERWSRCSMIPACTRSRTSRKHPAPGRICCSGALLLPRSALESQKGTSSKPLRKLSQALHKAQRTNPRTNPASF